MQYRTYIGEWIVLACFGVFGFLSQRAHGSFYLDTSSDQAHQQLALPYVNDGSVGNAVSFEAFYQGQSVWVSAVLLDPTHVLTAGHCVVSKTDVPYTFGPVIEGSSYTNPTAASTVVSAVVNPNMNFGDPFAGTDEAILTLASPLPMQVPTVMGTMNLGDILTCVGVGNYGSPSTGEFPQNGPFRAFEAPVEQFGDPYSVTYIAPEYALLDFDPYSGLPLNGKGMNGDSGSPAYNEAGRLVGVVTGQSGDTTEVGNTDVDTLDQPWIDSVIGVPEPSGLSLLALAGTMLWFQPRRHAV